MTKNKQNSENKDFSFLENIIKLLEGCDITEFNYEKGDLKIEIKRGVEESPFSSLNVPIVPSVTNIEVEPVARKKSALQEKEFSKTETPRKDEQENLYEIKSPIVGTFYEAPAPGDPPFVKVGDRVTPDTVVCIVEAMKLMNKIKAGVSGVIVEKLVKNEEPVQEGAVLFKVKLD